MNASPRSGKQAAEPLTRCHAADRVRSNPEIKAGDERTYGPAGGVPSSARKG